jgi:tRNA(fMet)-specific endonuclease VapC
MILFDTDVCIELLRNNQKVVKHRQKYSGAVAVSFMTAGELFYGATKSDNPTDNEQLVTRFLQTVVVIQTDMPILSCFGKIKAELKNKGIAIPDADILIAATALQNAEALITGNAKHFSRIEGLTIKNWIR